MSEKIHPIEGRYRTKEMAEIFTAGAKLYRWMRVEAALAKSHAHFGKIPEDAAKEIDKKASLEYVDVERVQEIDREIHHDLMAMVKGLAEQCDGDAGNYIHLGATSYDTEDTATAIKLFKALEVLKISLQKVLKALIIQSKENIDRVCVGRTHGQQALPTTYGMRFSVWASEFDRHLERLYQVQKRISVGKMSGAVGTMASFGDNGIENQKKVMEILAKEFDMPLEPALIANQVIQRDRHAEVLNLTGLIAGTIDKIAREIRVLQRTEIAEMFEPFKKKQVGSSTMPHKRNPHKSERLCSLVRVLKSNLIVGIDNIGLEDERDLTNSANERIIYPENFVLLDFMLAQLATLLEGLVFNEKNIQRNLNLTKGAFLAEKIMVSLVDKGIGRQEGHEILRQAAIQAREEDKMMKEILMEKQEISSNYSEEELDDLLDPSKYLGKAKEQVQAAVSYLSQKHGL